MSTPPPPGPLRPVAPPQGVDVWLVDLEAEGWPGAERLPEAERERAEQIRRPEVAGRWVAARWALRTVLGRYLGEPPESVRLAFAEQGKPRLDEGAPRLRFNLSHSAARGLIAVCGEREVGVDVERIKPRRDVLALAERELAPAAIARVRAAPPGRRQLVFYAAWAAHEARLKCLGSGIGTVPEPAPVAIRELDAGEEYAAAVAVTGTSLPRLRRYRLEPTAS